MKKLKSRPFLLPAVIGLCLIAVWLSVTVDAGQSKRATAISAKNRVEVEQTIHNIMGWAVNKDFDLFFSSIGDDSNYISVTPFQVKFGLKDVVRDTGFWADPAFKGISHELHDLRIHFSPSGDIAWYYCILDDMNEINGKPANWENVRWTGVVAKRDGHWRVVQQHISFPGRR
jgi:ketosteroid isomerase-like protein